MSLIFISSAHLHLPNYRKLAFELIRESPDGENGYLAAMGTEAGAGPAPSDPAEECRRRVERADAVVLILGFARGSLVPDDGKGRSFTEMEFDHTLELGRPLFVMVADREGAVDRASIDRDQTGIEHFRKRVLDGQSSHQYTCQYFSDLDDFRLKLRSGLQENLLRITARKGPAPLRVEIVARFDENPAMLIGREAQLASLDAWLTTGRFEQPALFIRAIGGMGKSSLLWTWFNNCRGEQRFHETGALWFNCYSLCGRLEDLRDEIGMWLGVSKSGTSCTWQDISHVLRDRKIGGGQPPIIFVDGLESTFFAEHGRVIETFDDNRSPRIASRAFAKSGSGDPTNDFRSFLDFSSGSAIRAILVNNLAHFVFSSRYIPASLRGDETFFGCIELGKLNAVEGCALENDPIVKVLRQHGIEPSNIEEFRPLISIEILRHPLTLVRVAQKFIERKKTSRLTYGDIFLEFVNSGARLAPGFTTQRKHGIFDYVLEGINSVEKSLLLCLAVARTPLPRSDLFDFFLSEENSEPGSSSPLDELQISDALGVLLGRVLVFIASDGGDVCSIDSVLKEHLKFAFPVDCQKIAKGYLEFKGKQSKDKQSGDDPLSGASFAEFDQRVSEFELLLVQKRIAEAIEKLEEAKMLNCRLGEVYSCEKQLLSVDSGSRSGVIPAEMSDSAELFFLLSSFIGHARLYHEYTLAEWGGSAQKEILARRREANLPDEEVFLLTSMSDEFHLELARYNLPRILDLDTIIRGHGRPDLMPFLSTYKLSSIYGTLSKGDFPSVLAIASFDLLASWQDVSHGLLEWYVGLVVSVAEDNANPAALFRLWQSDIAEGERSRLLAQMYYYNWLRSNDRLEDMAAMLGEFEANPLWRSIDFAVHLPGARFDLALGRIESGLASRQDYPELFNMLKDTQIFPGDGPGLVDDAEFLFREARYRRINGEALSAETAFRHAAEAFRRLCVSNESVFWVRLRKRAEQLGWNRILDQVEGSTDPADLDLSSLLESSVWGFRPDRPPALN